MNSNTQDRLNAENASNGSTFSSAVSSLLSQLDAARLAVQTFVTAWPYHLVQDEDLAVVLKDARQLPMQSASGEFLINRRNAVGGYHSRWVNYGPANAKEASANDNDASPPKSPRKRSLPEDDETPSPSSSKKMRSRSSDSTPVSVPGSRPVTPTGRVALPIINHATIEPRTGKGLKRQRAIVGVHRGTHVDLYDEMEGRAINAQIAEKKKRAAAALSASAPSTSSHPPTARRAPTPEATCATKPVVNYGPSLDKPTRALRREAALLAVDHGTHTGMYPVAEARLINLFEPERRAGREAAQVAAARAQDRLIFRIPPSGGPSAAASTSSQSPGKRTRDADADEDEAARPSSRPRSEPGSPAPTEPASPTSPPPSPRRSKRLGSRGPQTPKSK